MKLFLVFATLLCGAQVWAAPSCTALAEVGCSASASACSGTLSVTNGVGNAVVVWANTNTIGADPITSVSGWSETMNFISQGAAGATAAVMEAYVTQAASAHSSVALTVNLTSAPGSAPHRSGNRSGG